MEEEVIQKMKICFVCIAFFTLMGIIAYNNPSITSAEGTGVVSTASGGSVNVRSGPGTEHSVVGKINNGTGVTILEENDNGWLKIRWEALEGFVLGQYVTRGSSFDEEYAEILIENGFPESYALTLAALHQKYPSWEFIPQQTGLDWNTAVTMESVLGKNNVASTSVSSWKSVEKGAYNLKKGTWVAMDGSSWVAASKEATAHFMDPRNFLDENSIFMYLSHVYDPQLQEAAHLDSMVKGTFLEKTYQDGEQRKYADTIMDAAGQSGVNPYVLAAMILVEQASDGSGRSISGKVSGYEGYYNFFNIGAYASGSMDAIQRGLWFAKGSGTDDTAYNRPWNSRYASITGGAVYYGNNYVKKGQDTVYLKKFNVQGPNLYSHQYMTNIQGAVLEGQKVSSAYKNIKDTKLVFKIPIFQNMPSAPCAKPGGNGDPVNYLKNITVEGVSLNPAFDTYTQEYSLIVDNAVKKADISAELWSSKASVISGAGQVPLKVGMNVVNLTVQAENGLQRTYVLNISRQEGPEGNDDLPEQEPEGPKTEEPPAASGTAGDINGDGKVNIADLLMIQKSILGIEPLKEERAGAADLNNNGKIDIADLLKLQKALLGLEAI